jgi:hypothetical protein
MSDKSPSDDKTPDAFEPLKGGSPEVQRIIKKVLKLEDELLHQRQPHLNEDVLRIIKEEIT